MTTKPDPKKPDEAQLNSAAGSTTPPAAPAADVVQVPAAQWQAALDAIDALKKDNQKLMATADRGRMAAFESTEPKKIEPFVGLSTLEVEGVKKVIVAWRMVRDNVFVNTNGAIVQDQAVEIVFDDNGKQELSYIDFCRKTKDRLKARVVSRTKDDRGYETMVLDCEDGKERVVSTQFVN